MHDRRRHRRFRVKDNVFAVLHSNLIKVIPLIDLSMDGLAFEDHPMDGYPRQVGHIYGLDVFCADDECDLSGECSVQNIQFEIVSEQDIRGTGSFSDYHGKRCSVKFKQLSVDQKCLLAYFLHTNTIFEA